MQLKEIDRSFLTKLKNQLIEAHDLEQSDARCLVVEAITCLNNGDRRNNGKYPEPTEDFPTRLQNQIDWYCTYCKEAVEIRLRMAKHE